VNNQVNKEGFFLALGVYKIEAILIQRLVRVTDTVLAVLSPQTITSNKFHGHLTTPLEYVISLIR